MGDSYVIAIDFGTAFSGFAYNITPGTKKSEPQLRRWGKEVGMDTPKTPTCILFNENEEFMLFGYKAQMKYIDMNKEEAKKHFFFENFKMALYGRDLHREIMIKAANGKSMNALKVFTEALRFLKDEALETIQSNSAGIVFLACDFTWVLTVPAIWDQSAKQFMREAATQAEIVSEGDEEKLILALEPEAASLWCKTLPADGFLTPNHSGNKLDQSPGTKYIVVDCGGGTIDITVHEVLAGGALKELHKASGNSLGGQTVDRKFKEFLREIFFDGIWDEFEQNFPSGVQRMMYEFTRLKQVDKDVQLVCPHSLVKLAEVKGNIEHMFDLVKGASWDGEFIRISREKLRSFFDESFQGLTLNLNEILNNHKIDYILLVGGYAQSQILQQHVIDQFGDQCKVLCPHRAQEAILRGAIEFGRSPHLVVSRKSFFTYGYDTCRPFDESKHNPERKIVTRDGKELCVDIFQILVTVGDDVLWNETSEHILRPIEDNQTRMRMRFYRAEKTFPMYVDDSEVEEVGSIEMDMPDVKGGRNRKVKLEIMFGSTEITATATDLGSGSKRWIKFDFMTKAEPGSRKEAWNNYM